MFRTHLEHPHQTGHRPGHNCTGGTPGIVWVYPTYCWSPLARVHAPLRGRPPPNITPLPDSISLVRCLARIPIPCPMCCPIPYPIPFGSPPGNILKSLVNLRLPLNLIYGPQQYGLLFGSSYINHLDMGLGFPRVAMK